MLRVLPPLGLRRLGRLGCIPDRHPAGPANVCHGSVDGTWRPLLWRIFWLDRCGRK